jgi:hypothetical protein
MSHEDARSAVTAVEVPGDLDELLTPAWLTAALSSRFPGVQVRAVARGPVVERLSTNVRFRVECSPPPPPGLSPDLCVKGYFSEQGPAMGSAGEPEASFYRDLADDVGVHTLRSVWADVHPVTRHGVVITEDVVAAGGVFRDALSPCSVEQTASLLGELACLHAHTWEQARLADVPWLAPRALRTLQSRGVREIRGNFEGPLGTGVPGSVRQPERLVDAFKVLASRRPGPGWAVIHGDTHVGNTFLDRTGRPGLVDWQLVQYGHWAVDVAYHVGSALEPEVRASEERELLRHYLDRLGSRLGPQGVAPPSFDAAWTEYRAAMPYGFFLWGITLFVQPDIIAVLLRRLGTAVADLESYDALFGNEIDL